MDFIYSVSFFIYDEQLNIEINLALEDYVTPVFSRVYSKDILAKKANFLAIFNQIKEYFHFKHIKMTKNDLDLFYNTFNELDISLPNIVNIDIVEERIQLSNELTPKELLFVLYLDGKAVNAKIAKYWDDDYHLDTDYVMDKLLDAKYLTTEDYKYNLKKATKRELEQVLINNKMPHVGNKPDLIKRIKTLDEETLINAFRNLYCKLTEAGKEVSKHATHLNEFHKSYYRYVNNLQMEEFYLLSKKYDNLGAKEVCKIMIDKKENNTTDFDWNAFYQEIGNKKLKVKDEDDLTKIINKYTKMANPNNVKDIEPVSDDEFLSVVYKNKEKIRKEIVEKFKLEIPSKDEEKEEMKVVNEPFMPIFTKLYMISAPLCIVVIYLLYNYVFD